MTIHRERSPSWTGYRLHGTGHLSRMKLILLEEVGSFDLDDGDAPELLSWLGGTFDNTEWCEAGADLSGSLTELEISCHPKYFQGMPLKYLITRPKRPALGQVWTVQVPGDPRKCSFTLERLLTLPHADRVETDWDRPPLALR